MPEKTNFPQPGEKRFYYCKDCQKIVEWQIVKEDGRFYWHTDSCDKTVEIGKWPEKEIK